MKKKTRKLVIVFAFSAACIILGLYGGYKYVMNLASDKAIDMIQQTLTTDDLETLKKDPEVQKIMEQQIKESDSKTEDALTKRENAVTSNVKENKQALTIKTKEEAMNLLLKKFTMDELLTYSKKIRQEGLTDQVKNELKKVATERLTEEELQALKALAVVELEKNQKK